VEDVTGAAGTIAVGRVVRAAPDGYTLSLGNNSSHVMAGATYALQYDLLKDLEPVALLVGNPELFVAKKALPANDLMGLIAWLKANPGKATQGGAGVSRTSPASSSKEKRPRGFRSYLIGEPLLPSRTWWQVRSTW
jgi:tripartite-type tricarboxylate transporter receptor subunit TctC